MLLQYMPYRGLGHSASILCMILSAKITASAMMQFNAGDGRMLSSGESLWAASPISSYSSGVGVDSQQNEVSKSEEDAETSYHCCAQVSSKAEQRAVR
jgi:hypothetical protein